MSISGKVEYRIVELRPGTPQRNLVVIPVYVSNDGRIIGSADPYQGEFGITGSSLQAIESQMRLVRQAAYRPFLHVEDIPGCDEFVDPCQREVLPSRLIESLSSPEAIEHPSEGSDTGDPPPPGDDDVAMDASEPDPDLRHDDRAFDVVGSVWPRTGCYG